MAVYCEVETLVLAKHVTFTRPFLNETSVQNYLNSMYYVYYTYKYQHSIQTY